MFVNFRNTPPLAAANDSFQFAIGDKVDHVEGGWPAIVIQRARTHRGAGTQGPEIYTLEVAHGPNAGRRIQLLGECLIARSGKRESASAATAA